ncbi:TPA: EAL domain-containing protein [Kluyvera ascorbata]|nr:EAL domain-containing protein [Kluyvera ascorbata]
MKNLFTRRKYTWHPNIEHFRLEPFMDLTANCAIGYEVLSQLRDGIDPERWFTGLSGRQQIDILLQQIHCVSAQVKDTCFYNLTVEGFLNLNHCDIGCIANYAGVCLEVSDASALKCLNDKEQYLFFKNIGRLRCTGINIWVDDFSIDDLITLPAYKNNIDGIKIDKDEINSTHLKNIIQLVRQVLGNLPILIEGVETEGVKNKSMKYGADIGQGYLWNRQNLIVV